MDYPELSLKQLKRLTDETGIIQHAKYHLPNRGTGYTTDDNARALIVATRAYEVTGDKATLRLAENYVEFLHYAQLARGKFHNFMRYDRSWIDEVGSEDSFGRALWALGVAGAVLAKEGAGLLAQELLKRALPWAERLGSPRAWAWSLMGLAECTGLFDLEVPIKKTAVALAEKLVAVYRNCATADWPWFEDRLAYSNAILPAALFSSYGYLKDEEMLTIAKEALSFVTEVQWTGNYFKLIGCNGWYVRGDERADWDEQPEDAMCLVLAYTGAYRVTGDRSYLMYARAAMDWFYGRNANGLALYDPNTGGCRDGLIPAGVNLNQGAESTLAHLISRLEIAAAMVKDKERETAGADSSVV